MKILMVGKPASKCWTGLIALVIAVLVLSTFLMIQNEVFTTKRGYSESAVNSPLLHLPSTASNIYYLVPGVFGTITAYEFDIPEPHFLRWISEKGWKVNEINQAISARRVDPNGPTDFGGRVIVFDGWYLDETSTTSDLQVVYDRDSGRVFYYQRKY